MDWINSVSVAMKAAMLTAHLAVTEDSSLLRGHARVLDLRQEALEVGSGLLVAVEAGQRLLHPHALRRPRARAVICFLTSSDQIYFLFFCHLVKSPNPKR